MLSLNVSALLSSRGIENPTRHLVTQGFSYHTINRLLTGKVKSIPYEVLEKLCLVCICTPDDLFVWRKDEGMAVADNHPLHKLQPKAPIPNPVERIKRLTPDKLKKLEEFMDGLEG